MFKFSLGSFGAFPIFGDLVNVVSWKRLIAERHRPKFGPQQYLVQIRVPLTVKRSSSLWGHSVHLRFFGNLISRKPVVVEQNGQQFQPQKKVFSACRVLITVKYLSRSVWGHSVLFQLLATLYLLLSLNIQGSLHG